MKQTGGYWGSDCSLAEEPLTADAIQVLLPKDDADGMDVGSWEKVRIPFTGSSITGTAQVSRKEPVASMVLVTLTPFR